MKKPKAFTVLFIIPIVILNMIAIPFLFTNSPADQILEGYNIFILIVLIVNILAIGLSAIYFTNNEIKNKNFEVEKDFELKIKILDLIDKNGIVTDTTLYVNQLKNAGFIADIECKNREEKESRIKELREKIKDFININGELTSDQANELDTLFKNFDSTNISDSKGLTDIKNKLKKLLNNFDLENNYAMKLDAIVKALGLSEKKL